LSKILLRVNSKTEKEIELLDSQNHWLIGRSLKCDLTIPDYRISRVHCTVVRSLKLPSVNDDNTNKNIFYVIDGLFGNPLSKNGIYLPDHTRVFSYFLKDKSYIVLNNIFSLYFEIGHDLDNTIH
jgi:pSer/pThr/pTyr-binding forkhead associated (FHA) protein